MYPPDCFRKQVLRLSAQRTRIVDGEGMFIRFVSGEMDDNSRVSAGLFCAVSQLEWIDDLPQYEFGLVAELERWFDSDLPSPVEHLPRDLSYERAVCWFKPTAREHLARAWELVTILERNDVLIWTIKSRTTGRVYYEDDVQVFAVPSRELRSLCRR